MPSISRASLGGLTISRVIGGEALARAWTEIARASPLVRLVGEAWGEPPDPSLRWAVDSQGRALHGAPVGDNRVHTSLKFEGMQLSLLRAGGRTVADLVLRGRAPSAARAWLIEQATAALGAQPRPALEPLTVGDAPFEAPSDGLNHLADLFEATAALLERLLALPGVSGSIAFDADRLEPRATLEMGGVGLSVCLAQPGRLGQLDGPIGSTCGWVVEPEGGSYPGPGSLPALSRGAWLQTEDGTPTAMLTLDEAMADGTPEARGQTLAGFVSGSVNALLAVTGR